MRIFTDEEVIGRVASTADGFEGWKRGSYDIWIRSSTDAFDLFDDKAFTYYVDQDGAPPTFVMARHGTTNAGSYYLVDHLENPLGCAVLKSDQIVYESHVYGYHHQDPNNPAYIENKGFPYFRDPNRNHRAEEIGPEYHDVIGANIHHAGTNSTVIKNWSAGCLVTDNLAKFQAFLLFMINKGKAPLTLCILKEW